MTENSGFISTCIGLLRLPKKKMAGFLTGNRSSRVETQDSKRISQAYFPFLAGSRLLLLQAFLHVNCFFSLSMDCMDSQQGGSSEPDWLHQEARAVLSPLLSPPCDSRATEAITWVKQSPQPSLSMTSEKYISSQHHTHVHYWPWWDVVGASAQYLQTGQQGDDTCGQDRRWFGADAMGMKRQCLATAAGDSALCTGSDPVTKQCFCHRYGWTSPGS